MTEYEVVLITIIKKAENSFVSRRFSQFYYYYYSYYYNYYYFMDIFSRYYRILKSILHHETDKQLLITFYVQASICEISKTVPFYKCNECGNVAGA
jgi:hypothetical protein